MPDEILISVPTSFLLTIATMGNMGTGDLPELMKLWARKHCFKNGLQEEFYELQRAKLDELQKNLINVLGQDIMEALDKLIDEAIAEPTD